MTKKIRYAALLLACLCCIPVFAGCGQNKRVVATWDEYDIYYEYIRFATLNFKAELEKIYGDDDDSNGTIWDNPVTAKQYKPLLEERVWNMVTDNYAIFAACRTYGIGKDVFESDTVQDAVDQNMKALRAEYATYTAYEEALAESFMTEDVFRFYFGVEEMKKQLYNAMKEENAFLTDKEAFHNWLLDGNYMYVQHVARFVSEGDAADFERDIIEGVYDGLASGEHDIAYYIDSLNNEDTTNTKPYFMVRHIYDDALVDAALKLEDVGDHTEIIEVDDAFYILVRMPEESDALAGELNSLLSLYQWGIVGEKVESVKKDIRFEMTDFGKGLNLLDIK